MTIRLFTKESVDIATEEALDWLEVNCREQVLVLFSGGKDSIVTEALVKMSGVPYVLNSTLTGIDPPQVTQFIRKYYPRCTFVRPHLSFWHLITTCNPPGGTGKGIKWCCTKIKERPSHVLPQKTRVLGIRAEESSNRASYGRINYVKDQTHLYPIYHWKEWQVWEFIERHRLPTPSLYSVLDRIGCVICPNHSGHHGPYRRLFPGHFKCFEKYVHLWWDKRVSQGKEMWHGSPEAFLKDWYSGKFYYYKQNSCDHINL